MILLRNKTKELWNIILALREKPQTRDTIDKIENDLKDLSIANLNKKEIDRIVHLHNAFTIFNSWFSIFYVRKIGDHLILSLNFMSKQIAYLVMFKKSYIAIFEGLEKGGKNG